MAPADPDADGYLDVTPDGVVDELTEIRTAVDPYGELDGFDPAVHRYRLTSRRLKGVFNSSGREVEALREKEGTSYAHVHPDDLAELGVADGDLRRAGVAAGRGADRRQGRARRRPRARCRWPTPGATCRASPARRPTRGRSATAPTA